MFLQFSGTHTHVTVIEQNVCVMCCYTQTHFPNNYLQELLSQLFLKNKLSFFKEKLQKRQKLFIFFVLPGKGPVLVGVEGRAVVGAWVGVCTTESLSFK